MKLKQYVKRRFNLSHVTKVTYSCDARRIQLGKTLNRFLCFINRKCLTVILDRFNCTGKFCYRYGNIQNTEAATGGVLKAFTNFRGNHPCQSLFFDKIAGLRPATVLKRDSDAGVFCEFCEIFKNTFFVSDCFSKLRSCTLKASSVWG